MKFTRVLSECLLCRFEPLQVEELGEREFKSLELGVSPPAKSSKSSNNSQNVIQTHPRQTTKFPKKNPPNIHPKSFVGAPGSLPSS